MIIQFIAYFYTGLYPPVNREGGWRAAASHL